MAEFHQGLSTSTIILSQNIRCLKLIYRKQNNKTRCLRVIKNLKKDKLAINRVLNNNTYLIIDNNLSLIGLEVRAFLGCETFQCML